MADVDEEILAKSGPELFKELLRVYATAEVEDYYRVGQWKDDVMRLDIQLIYSHAREAGAPYPPPLDEVKLPANMPKAIVARQAVAVGKSAAGLKLPGAVTAERLAAAKAGAAAAKAGSLAPGATAATAAVTPGSMAAELRLIALFVAKWKLDPTKTKLLLAKLTSPRRRYVISQFKAVDQTGEEATKSLEEFIKTCEAENSWPAAAAAAPAAAAATNGAPATAAARPVGPTRPVLARPVGATRPGVARPGLAVAAGPRPVGTVTARGLTPPKAGMKRPLVATTPVLDPAKRLRAITPKAGLMTPTTPGAVRPRAPGAVNPGLRGTLLQPRYG